MTDRQLDLLLRQARTSYNPPPEVLPLEEIWSGVEREIAAVSSSTPASAPAPAPAPSHVLRIETPTRRRRLGSAGWLSALAATLVFGIALGRVTTFPSWGSDARRGAPGQDDSSPREVATGSAPFRFAPTNYLDETAALVLSLPAELQARRGSPALTSRADDLLLQTRLLLDSPDSTDPALRSLLLDLEVVLAQVVRLRADRHPNDVNLLERALEQRDVIARLRTAVTYHVAN